MFARSLRSPGLLILALFLTLCVSLFPSGWLRPWTGEVAGLLNLPVQPFGEAGNLLGAWMRPVGDPDKHLPPEIRARLREVEEDRDIWIAKHRDLEQENLELREQVAQLQQVDVEQLAHNVSRLQARITSRTPGEPLGVVQINRGTINGVQKGAIAVYRGVHLVGRVVETDRAHSQVLPAGNPATGLITAAVIPADQPDMPLEYAPRIQLSPTGDGSFTADADKAHAISRGDTVRLLDPLWPIAARAMVIGHVQDVQDKDDQPLRHQLLVQGRYPIGNLGQMTLLIEQTPVLADGDRSEAAP